MAIAFDAATNTVSDTSATVTFNHTTSGTDRLLVVPCASLNNGSLDAVTGVTYNGVSLTRLGSPLQVGAFNWIIYLYYLANPASGTNSVVVTRNTTTGEGYGAAISYTGVDQASPIGASTNASGVPGPITTTLSSTVDNAWFFVTNANADGSPSASTNSTARVNNNSLCTGFDFGPKTPAGSLNMQQTFTGTRDWRSIMISLKPAATSANTGSFFAFF